MADQLNPPAAAQQPAPAVAARQKIPVPIIQPFMHTVGESQGDVWIRNFEAYLRCISYNQDQAQPLQDEGKKALLISHLGQEGLRSFGDTPEYAMIDQLTLQQLQDRVISHFRRTPSVFKARYDFFSRKQESSESVSEFLLALRALTVDCDFGEFTEELLKTQLVCHTVDKKAQTELFARRDVMALNDVTNYLTASEAASQDSQAMQPNSTVQVVRGRGRGRGFTQRTQTNTPAATCTNCGNKGHQARAPTCPAKDKQCNKCGKTGHFGNCCITSQYTQRGQSSFRRGRGRGSQRGSSRFTQQGTFEVQLINQQSRGSNLVHHSFHIRDGPQFYPMEFMVDCGANTSLLSHSSYKRWFSHVPLSPVNASVNTVDGRPLSRIHGVMSAEIAFGPLTHTDCFYVVSGRNTDLLGNNFLQPLKVQIDCGNLSVAAATESIESVLREFPVLKSQGIGEYKGQSHRISVSPNAEPYAVPCRPVPFALREAVTKEIQAMDAQGIWEPVQASEWAHPMVSVKKKDGGVRITTDLSRLNKCVIPERFPLPRIKDIITDTAGAIVFSKLDLREGYFHIPLHPDSRDFTTTITPLGLRRYKRLPMGLKDSASAFQRRVYQTLHGLQGVSVYIDDVIIYGRTQEEHDRRLRAALSRLADRDFRLQEKKLIFSQSSIPAFGFVLSKDGVSPDPENVKSIVAMEAPTSQKQILRFLGSINYFQDFLRDVSSIAEPLRALTRKDAEFKWGEIEDKAFKTLKAMLAEFIQLQIFDPDAETFVTTDASDVGIGAMLTQRRSGQPQEMPISFFNRTLDSAERNYSASEREALACIAAMEHWEHFLFGRHFVLRMDHQALSSILSGIGQGRRQSSKFVRWSERLAAFDYKVEYLPGKANEVADFLSRLDQRAKQLGVAEVFQSQTITADSLKNATQADPDLQTVHTALNSQNWASIQLSAEGETAAFKEARTQISYEDGIFFKDHRVIVPASLRSQVLESVHKGHPGIIRTKSALRQFFWWPGVGKQVDRFVRNCTGCQSSTKSKSKQQIPQVDIPKPDKPAVQWGLDITGPFFNEGKYLVVLIDYASRYPEILVAKDITSGAIIKWLDTVWERYGLPEGLVTDNGPQFVSSEFTAYLASKDIHHYTTPVYHPQQNGLVEVFNRFLKHGIQTFGAMPWHKGLHQLIKSYRFTPQEDGKSPADKFFNRKARPEYQPNLTKPQRRTHIVPGRRVPDNSQSHRPFTGWSQYSRGQKVLVKVPWVPKGVSPWKGPYTVTKVLGSFTFQLSDGQVWHADRMKRWVSDVHADQWVHVDDVPNRAIPVQVRNRPHQGLRRSHRRNFGQPPQRYGFRR